MQWTRKARIQRVFSRTPVVGDRLYFAMQRRIGSLEPNPFLRIDNHVAMLRLLRQQGVDAVDARCVEVGTGHHPSLPILFHLCGAREVVTVDLNRRLQWQDVSALMRKLVEHRTRLHETYVAEGLAEAAVLDGRLEAMAAEVDQPQAFFERAGIRYVAPGDAADLAELADGSVDIHFSSNVLEHIPGPVLHDIFVEARRVLGTDGLAVHVVDPSDHYAQSDSSIPLLNFLQYSQREWDRLADNRFAYHNRLRGPQFLDILEEAGFTVLQHAYRRDQRSLDELAAGFAVHPDFARFDNEDLAITDVEVVARPGRG